TAARITTGRFQNAESRGEVNSTASTPGTTGTRGSGMRAPSVSRVGAARVPGASTESTALTRSPAENGRQLALWSTSSTAITQRRPDPAAEKGRGNASESASISTLAPG